jgi:hypothetical protein
MAISRYAQSAALAGLIIFPCAFTDAQEAKQIEAFTDRLEVPLSKGLNATPDLRFFGVEAEAFATAPCVVDG